MTLEVKTICDSCRECPFLEIEMNGYYERVGNRFVDKDDPACAHYKVCYQAMLTLQREQRKQKA